MAEKVKKSKDVNKTNPSFKPPAPNTPPPSKKLKENDATTNSTPEANPPSSTGSDSTKKETIFTNIQANLMKHIQISTELFRFPTSLKVGSIRKEFYNTYP